MPVRYFKPDTLIPTSCENCGTQRTETLARLYSHDRLLCPACGQEHTPERSAFRQNVDETEATVANLPAWLEKAISLLHRWCSGNKSASPP